MSHIFVEQLPDLCPDRIGLILLIVRLEHAELFLVGDCERQNRCKQRVLDAAFELARLLVLAK